MGVGSKEKHMDPLLIIIYVQSVKSDCHRKSQNGQEKSRWKKEHHSFSFLTRGDESCRRIGCLQISTTMEVFLDFLQYYHFNDQGGSLVTLLRNAQIVVNLCIHLLRYCNENNTAIRNK